MRVTVWNEGRVDEEPAVAEHYPDGMHAVIADFLESAGHTVRTATLDDPEHGLTESVLDETDVLVWWGHVAHDEVSDEIVERTHQHILDGMGLVALHSAHESKLFQKLMGTSCHLSWRDVGERQRISIVEPSHPIAEGLENPIEVPRSEMYGERFDVPAPDTLVMISGFEGADAFRSGCCYRRGKGRIFYFQPGHQTYPIYHQPEIQQVITNGVEWAEPVDGPTVTFEERPLPEE